MTRVAGTRSEHGVCGVEVVENSKHAIALIESVKGEQSEMLGST